MLYFNRFCLTCFSGNVKMAMSKNTTTHLGALMRKRLFIAIAAVSLSAMSFATQAKGNDVTYLIPPMPESCKALLERQTLGELDSYMSEAKGQDNSCIRKMPELTKQYMDVLILYKQGLTSTDSCKNVRKMYDRARDIMNAASRSTNYKMSKENRFIAPSLPRYVCSK